MFYLRIVALALLCPCALGDQPAPAVEWQAPTGGWRYDGLTNDPDEARVAYPNPPIDRGSQRHRIAIEGTLKPTDADKRPHTLAVNGNPLPLYTDDNGRFVRPYAFGAGSNSLALLTNKGDTVKTVQFYEANTTKTPTRLRIVLGWDDPKAEVDMHVITPDGQHAFYGDPVLRDGSGLDVDGVDGPGPEIFTMAAPLHGTYLIYINYWGNFGNEGYNFTPGANNNIMITARITLVLNENTINEKRENFIVPLRAIGELQLVKTLHF